MTNARRPSVAACSTVFLARLTRNSGSGAEGSIVMSNRTAGLVALGVQRVLDVLGVLLSGALGVPHHPVASPVILQHFVVDQAEDFDGDLHVVRTPVVIAVHDLGAPVHRRPRRHGLDIGECLEDGLRRGVDHDLSRSAYRHDSNLAT